MILLFKHKGQTKMGLPDFYIAILAIVVSGNIWTKFHFFFFLGQ